MIPRRPYKKPKSLRMMDCSLYLTSGTEYLDRHCRNSGQPNSAYPAVIYNIPEFWQFFSDALFEIISLPLMSAGKTEM